MKRYLVLFALIALLVLPASSQAIELAVGLNQTSFSEDADAIDSDNGVTVDFTLGDGMARLMFSLVDAEPEGLDYNALMAGVAFVLDAGFDFRVFALLSKHELETLEGSGITLGGAFGFPILPAAEIVGDIRLSQWDDSGFDVGTGTISLMLRLEI